MTTAHTALDPAGAYAAQRYLRLHAALMLAAALALSVLLACVVLGDVLQLLPPQRLLPFGLALLAGVAVLLPYALRLAWQVRCPRCGRHCFVRGRLTTGGPLNASHDGLALRLGTAQLRARRFACLHCGATVELDPGASAGDASHDR